jgi:hypothetical protein
VLPRRRRGGCLPGLLKLWRALRLGDGASAGGRSLGLRPFTTTTGKSQNAYKAQGARAVDTGT